MKFTPCTSTECTKEGSHCKGCGRSHEEIAETKSMVMNLVSFAKKQDYENPEDFADFIRKSLAKKLQTP